MNKQNYDCFYNFSKQAWEIQKYFNGKKVTIIFIKDFNASKNNNPIFKFACKLSKRLTKLIKNGKNEISCKIEAIVRYRYFQDS